uniref:Transmembrane protein n=1 Tax=Chromera velia CCMP2878 TaxID=1169474 RepID=A0A0G4GXH9_9ALVE|eukprot:Cvel_767.t1-p1 / transcript=Cvel_767.t1 / gene=Cvel_767 / organism=Chromera_velia_CCMP2878 / gene_product=hypothetical protein / transcript_product=hypothetical protein / location=Cvel_scaffold24:3901-5421(-) / protein_length=373 / sequence_SO=supercontig / SO=protein_coding / is_pseudo=false
MSDPFVQATYSFCYGAALCAFGGITALLGCTLFDGKKQIRVQSEKYQHSPALEPREVPRTKVSPEAARLSLATRLSVHWNSTNVASLERFISRLEVWFNLVPSDNFLAYCWLRELQLDFPAVVDQLKCLTAESMCVVLYFRAVSSRLVSFSHGFAVDARKGAPQRCAVLSSFLQTEVEQRALFRVVNSMNPSLLDDVVKAGFALQQVHIQRLPTQKQVEAAILDIQSIVVLSHELSSSQPALAPFVVHALEDGRASAGSSHRHELTAEYLHRHAARRSQIDETPPDFDEPVRRPPAYEAQEDKKSYLKRPLPTSCTSSSSESAIPNFRTSKRFRGHNEEIQAVAAPPAFADRSFPPRKMKFGSSGSVPLFPRR